MLRFAQRPRGVFHGTVFHQFSGRMGPSAAVCGHDGTLYVARYELSGGSQLSSTLSAGRARALTRRRRAELSQHGVISVLDREGSLVREITVDGAEVTGLTLRSVPLPQPACLLAHPDAPPLAQRGWGRVVCDRGQPGENPARPAGLSRVTAFV